MVCTGSGHRFPSLTVHRNVTGNCIKRKTGDHVIGGVPVSRVIWRYSTCFSGRRYRSCIWYIGAILGKMDHGVIEDRKAFHFIKVN